MLKWSKNNNVAFCLFANKGNQGETMPSVLDIWSNRLLTWTFYWTLKAKNWRTERTKHTQAHKKKNKLTRFEILTLREDNTWSVWQFSCFGTEHFLFFLHESRIMIHAADVQESVYSRRISNVGLYIFVYKVQVHDAKAEMLYSLELQWSDS